MPTGVYERKPTKPINQQIKEKIRQAIKHHQAEIKRLRKLMKEI